MSAPTKLATFAVALLVVFGLAYLGGATLGPDRSSDHPPRIDTSESHHGHGKG